MRQLIALVLVGGAAACVAVQSRLSAFSRCHSLRSIRYARCTLYLPDHRRPPGVYFTRARGHLLPACGTCVNCSCAPVELWGWHGFKGPLSIQKLQLDSPRPSPSHGQVYCFHGHGRAPTGGSAPRRRFHGRGCARCIAAPRPFAWAASPRRRRSS